MFSYILWYQQLNSFQYFSLYSVANHYAWHWLSESYVIFCTEHSQHAKWEAHKNNTNKEIIKHYSIDLLKCWRLNFFS